MVIPEQVRPESPESWIPARSSLQPYVQWFGKFVTYYMFDHNYIVDTCDIRRQLGRYIMAPKRKRGAKLKAKGCAEGCYHHMFNNMLESSSDLLRTNTHKGCSVLTATDYNYELRSVIGQEDNYNVTKWTWFNQQVRDTLLCSWMISRSLVDFSNIGRAIGRLLDVVYAPSASMRKSIGSTTSFFHTSMVVNRGSDDHLRIREFIHDGLLSSISKEQQNGEVSLNNVSLGLDYKLPINMLMKQLYIAVQYFYVTN